MATRLFIVILFQLFSLQCLLAQWSTVHYFTFGGDTLPDIAELSFVNAKSGIAACRSVNPYWPNSNRRGAIMTTNDSSLTWDYRLLVDSFYFEKVIHLDSNIAMAAGSHFNFNWTTFNKGILARSINGGATWDTSIFPYHLKTLTNVNDSIIFITGREYLGTGTRTILLKSIDKGMNWTEMSFPYLTERVTGVSFISDSIGFMTGFNQIIYKTVNQGISWTKDTIGINSGASYLTNISTPSPSNLYTLNSNSEVYSSKDTGTTWNLLTTLNYSFLAEVEFANDSTGFIPASFSIFKTIDGGVTWNLQSSSPPSQGMFFDALTEIFALSPTTLYATGFHSQLYRTYNGGDIISSIRDNDFNDDKSLLVYPSPTNGLINIPYAKNIRSIEVFNMQGQLIQSVEKMSQETIKIDLIGDKGFYLIRVNLQNGSTKSTIVSKY